VRSAPAKLPGQPLLIPEGEIAFWVFALRGESPKAGRFNVSRRASITYPD
jgi:hypothetical protein